MSPMPVPAGGENTLSVNDWSPGAPPPMILIRTTVATAMIRSTVTPSIESRIRVAVWAGKLARAKAPARAMKAMRNSDHSGWLFQMPISSRNVAPKMPAAALVTQA